MATLEELDFKLIIKHDEFDKTIADVKAQAQQLNTEISKLLELKAKNSGVSSENVTNQKKINNLVKEQKKDQVKILELTKQQAKGEFREYIQSLTSKSDELKAMANHYKEMSRNASEAAKNQTRLNESQKENHATLAQSSRLWQQVSGLALTYFSVDTARRFVTELVRVSAEFEKQRVSLQAILNDAPGANKIFEQVKALAVVSPFNFKELITYTKMLSAYSIPMQELYDTTKMLADVSAGLGVGMDRLVLAYGQIRSASFLRGQEVRQLTEAGVPILTELAKQIEELEGRAVSASEVFDRIATRQVTFQMVEKVFKDMTSEGGKFYKMQEILADTLSGKISNLVDAWQMMLSAMGEASGGLLNSTVDGLRSLIENYEKVGRVITDLIVVFGAYKTAMIAINILNATSAQMELAAAAGKSVSAFTSLAAAIKETAAAQKIMNLVAKTNPYALIASAIALIVTFAIQARNKIDDLAQSQKILDDATRSFNANVQNETLQLDFLFSKLQKATVGTKEYDKARMDLLNNYGTYLSNIDKEAIAVGNLTGIYEKLTEAIVNKNRQQALEEGLTSISEVYTDAYEEVTKKLNKAFDEYAKKTDIPLAKGLKQEIADVVFGRKSLKDVTSMAQTFFRQVRDVIGQNPQTGKLVYSKFRDSVFEGLRKDMLSASEQAKKTRQDLSDALDVAYGVEQNNQQEIPLTEFAKRVQNTLAKFGITKAEMSKGLWVDEYTNEDEYLENIRKRYAEIGDQIKDTASYETSRLETLTKEKEMLDAIFKATEKSPLASAKTPYRESNKKVSAPDELTARINTIKELMKWYTKFKEQGLDSDTIKNILTSYFPDEKETIQGERFKEVLLELADALAKYNREGAQALRDSVAGKNVEAIYDAYVAAEKYRQSIEKLLNADFNLKGEGIAFDISKLIVDLNTKNNLSQTTYDNFVKEIDKQEDYIKAKINGTEAEKKKAWEDYKKMQLSILNELSEKEIKYNKKVVQEKVNDLAQAFVKDQYTKAFGAGNALTDWSDKSIGQIQEIINGLQRIYNQDINNILGREVIESAQKAGISLKKLGQYIREIVGRDIDNALIEKMKLIVGLVNTTLSSLSRVTSAMANLGEVTDNEVLKSIGKVLDTLNEVASIILDNDALMKDWAGTFGEIAKATSKAGEELGSSFGGVTSGMEESKEYSEAMKKVLGDNAELVAGIAKKGFEAAEGLGEAAENGESIADGIMKSADWITMIIKLVAMVVEGFINMIAENEEANKAMKEYLATVKKIKNEMMIDENDTIFGKNIINAISATKDALNSVNGVLDNAKIGMASLGRLFGSDAYFDSLDDYLKAQEALAAGNYELAKSFISIDKVQAALEEGRISSPDLELYFQYLEDYKNAIADLFSNLASDISNNMIEAFKQTGDAVSDLTNAFANMGETLAQSILQSLIIEKVLTTFKDDIFNIFDTYNESGDIVALTGALKGTMEGMKEGLEGLSDFWNILLQQFQEYGWLSDTESDNNLATGIKTITEDTANLLASYVNGIRSDVSQSKAAIMAILGLLPNSPTLAEYLTQIEANTANTAQNTAMVLADIRAMMTSETGATSLRVLVQ